MRTRSQAKCSNYRCYGGRKNNVQTPSQTVRIEKSFKRHGSAPKIICNLQSSSTINALPDCAMIQVFGYLSAPDRIKIERVCRKWSRLSRQAWHNFRRMGFWSFLYDSLSSSEQVSSTIKESYASYNFWAVRRHAVHCMHLKQILSRCRSALREIDLSGYREHLDYRILPIIGQYCPNIESIDLTGIVVTNSSLRSLAIRCTRLKNIVFQRCFQDSIVDRGLSCLLANCQHLQALNLSENERITGQCFNELPPTLKSIKLSTCCELTDAGIRAIADRCPNVEMLHLDSCDLITEDGLQYALNRLNRLQILRLGEYYATVQGVQLLIEPDSLPNLRELFLNDNYLITDNSLKSLASACKNLYKLNLSGANRLITDRGLAFLCRLKNLRDLNLSFLHRITDHGVSQLAKNGLLQILLLNRCLELTDICALELAQHCNRLTRLELIRCPKITDVSVWAFYRSANERDCCLKLSIGQTGVTIKEKEIFHPKLELEFSEKIYTTYF